MGRGKGRVEFGRMVLVFMVVLLCWRMKEVLNIVRKEGGGTSKMKGVTQLRRRKEVGGSGEVLELSARRDEGAREEREGAIV